MVTLCGLQREVRAVSDRIRNIRPLCAQFKKLPLPGAHSDWEVLARHNVFQKTNVARLAIENAHSVHLKHGIALSIRFAT
jgi:hypothetical protein